jgi:GTP-binding protein LepA
MYKGLKIHFYYLIFYVTMVKIIYGIYPEEKILSKIDMIRNFSIVAHIDHGKSTLADRLLELCGAVEKREMENQILDNMELERERGITIKARAVKLDYKAADGESYILNLIDTPGHVDFNYEVSRSLAACEGALLVVDAAQGIEAQTLANTYLAIDAGLEVLPVINKIDLIAADPDRTKREIEDIIGIAADEAPLISAKNGVNIGQVLEYAVKNIPCPKGDEDAPLKSLIFDSQYDQYKGVVVYVRVFDGVLRAGDRVRMLATGAEYDVVEVGYLRPLGLEKSVSLSPGEVGYFTASIKNVRDTTVGDTVTTVNNPLKEAMPGYRKVQSMVFSGVYPSDGAKYPDLRDALDKLKLNDASLTFEAESSVALGFGFRCGFLGLLHMEVIQERLEREFNLDLITTAPSVIYKVHYTDGREAMIDNPLNFPDPTVLGWAEEPFVAANIITPTDYTGGIMELCQERRGIFKDMKYIDTGRVELHYELPLNEIIYDFFDALKSRTRGYASLDYELMDYRKSELVKLDILLNGDVVDALSFIVHKDKAYARARRIAEKLKDNIPRQMFEVPVQAAIGAKIIARETVKALRKDVLAKCYGGDITRKKKLLEKQKEGKKRMRSLGSVEVPQEAFMAVLKLDE